MAAKFKVSDEVRDVLRRSELAARDDLAGGEWRRLLPVASIGGDA
jgi:hypothetical protein